MPEHASLFFDPIAAGAAQAGRTLADLDLQVAAARIRDELVLKTNLIGTLE